MYCQNTFIQQRLSSSETWWSAWRGTLRVENKDSDIKLYTILKIIYLEKKEKLYFY
jgi:hypothetical protein